MSSARQRMLLLVGLLAKGSRSLLRCLTPPSLPDDEEA